MITPQENHPVPAKELGVPALYLKREDLHPLGSHKGRSIPVMIDGYLKRGDKKFSISSSGNAALAAARYVQRRNEIGADISLEIFIGRNIPEEKKSPLGALANEKIRILEKERPLQSLLEAMKLGAQSLRQSTDDTALIGYETLAQELSEIPDLNAVFIATSSGATAQAIGEYFLKKDIGAEIHIVQTSSCHPIAGIFDVRPDIREISIANAIADKVAHRREKIMEIVSRTKGSGWIVSNEEIASAQEKLRNAGISGSPNGALALAGLMRANSQDRRFSGPVVCIIGGK
jgi:threonine dehydratase